MESVERPSRSDIHLSREEEAKIEGETRDYFDQLAPKRHTKPQRSEYSSRYVDAYDHFDSNAEYAEFQRLQEEDHQSLIYNGSEVTEEFRETEYYKDLNCVDKQHHMTGTGFIKMEAANAKCFSLAPDTTNTCHSSCKGNPATNDWIPSADDTETFSSDKPNRSDN
ncbi:Maternal effect embryo arrest 59 [Melia azedarach]|uniref:Maternal effect embryo arrest 59 n=1 Tax=Melia azedarach TaxID=155640 RepID=A0ACC1YR74_MELAZ|nr:Maternal effect embryo arrest 59 [Melia azedarach]